MAAGSAAGIAEHIAMFPVDTIKTRMQALAAPGSGVSGTVSRAMSSIIRKEGFLGLYSGVGAVAVGAGPSHGIYFVVYEYMKSFLGATDDEHRPLETSAAAAAATVVADAFMTPLDVVKQRLQLGCYISSSGGGLRIWLPCLNLGGPKFRHDLPQLLR